MDFQLIEFMYLESVINDILEGEVSEIYLCFNHVVFNIYINTLKETVTNMICNFFVWHKVMWGNTKSDLTRLEIWTRLKSMRFNTYKC